MPNALFVTRLIIAQLAVHEQDREVDGVEVREWRGEAGRERPGDGHEPVSAARNKSVYMLSDHDEDCSQVIRVP